jgi:peptidoglycan/xylan/chitin deacetylase (PgdA/CDA1 family)
MTVRTAIITAGFAGFRASGLHRAARAATRGLGLILTFHRVLSDAPATGYAPNRGLEITPQFLDLTLEIVRQEGFELVPLEEARRRLVEREGSPFAALTFDDGYRDTLAEALPLLERHNAPFTVYCATGFIERTARLWWLELEEAIRGLQTIEIGAERLAARTPAEKSAAFDRIYWLLRERSEAELLEAVGDLARRAGVDTAALANSLFMDWSEVTRLSRHPLAAIGAHSVTHRRLAHWSAAEARAEMADSKAALERRLGIEVSSFAYPVGDPTSAGQREFELAQELGFATAVTTRPGMLFREHARRLTSLPRVSINGRWQRADALQALLSGAPFWLWNRGRRVAAA